MDKTDYKLTREQLNSITDVEVAFGTTRLLPPFEIVPDEFKNGNIYTRLLDCMFSGAPLPDGEIEFRENFRDPEALRLLPRLVQAHLRSFEPKHEHKIAGLGYLVSLICEMREAQKEKPMDEALPHSIADGDGAGANSNQPISDADMPHAVIEFLSDTNLPRFSMKAGERWGFIVHRKYETMLENIKRGERFDFAGGQVLAQDVMVVYEGDCGIGYSIATRAVPDPAETTEEVTRPTPRG